MLSRNDYMRVKKRLHIEQNVITASFDTGVVHIMNDEELKSLLRNSLGGGTQILIKTLKQEYSKEFKQTLQISDKSFEVEIWGHLYCEYLFHDLYRRVRIEPLYKLDRFVKYHCKTIDIGESGKDSNRFFWNLLVPGRKGIAWGLKRRLQRKRL